MKMLKSRIAILVALIWTTAACVTNHESSPKLYGDKFTGLFKLVMPHSTVFVSENGVGYDLDFDDEQASQQYFTIVRESSAADWYICIEMEFYGRVLRKKSEMGGPILRLNKLVQMKRVDCPN